MASIADLKVGEELDNAALCALFGCGPQGGMRRAKATNTLVLVCNHVFSIYDDRWIDGVLHYTGMGQTGDQSLTFMQNKTLAESATNGVTVHLFEVHRSQAYTYAGEVELAAAPYAEKQHDETKAERQVWVFPLRPESGAVAPVPLSTLREAEQRTARQARLLSDQEIAVRAAESGRLKVGVRSAVAPQYQRSPWVAEHAKRRAAGRCELCGGQAPFKDAAGKPYLETHHIVWLARGGADTIENTAALCPNCHRRMHVLDAETDRATLTRLVVPFSAGSASL